LAFQRNYTIIIGNNYLRLKLIFEVKAKKRDYPEKIFKNHNIL